MNPVKIAAIGIVLGVGLIVSIFTTSSFFEKQTPEKSAETPIKKQTENSFKNPLTWLKEKSAEQIISIEQRLPIKDSAPSANSEPLKSATTSQKLFKEVSNFLSGGMGAKQISSYEIENYSTELLKAKQNTGGFTIEEFTAIKKDEYGRPLFPEELFKLAENGDNSESLKISFRAWQGLAEKYLDNLKKMTVADALSPTHQALIDWVGYFIGTHQKLAGGDLSKAEMDSLFNQYRQKAKIELPKIQKVLSLSQPTVSANLNRFLGLIPDLIPKAFAQEQTATCDFGGAVYFNEWCCTGVIVTLETPPGENFCEDELMLYYVTLIIYPYEYGYFWVGSCILGKATRVPGICPDPEDDCVTSSETSATIMYFGSAPTTDFCLF